MQQHNTEAVKKQLLQKWPSESIRVKDNLLRFSKHMLIHEELDYLLSHVSGHKTIKRSGTGLTVLITP
jgi:uncharacterized protein YicC (UPF0701 family)